ncbi:MAG: hypothetical protein ACI9W7_000772 [Porticoccaceae bacterium]
MPKTMYLNALYITFAALNDPVDIRSPKKRLVYFM